MEREQRTTPIIEAWLKVTSDVPYGSEMGVRRVKARVRQTRQRGRWWPLPSFRHTAAAGPAETSTPSHPTSIPTTSGRLPTATGRTLTMLNATKFVVASAIVALFGGLLLSGLLIRADDDDVLPAAASPSPTADLLSTLITEEVEPGVRRLTADGVGRSLRGLLAVERGPAGPVWLMNRDGGRAFRLDTGGATKIDVAQQRPLVSSTSDGSLVVLVGREAYLVTPTASDASDASGSSVAISIAPALPSRVRTPTALAGAADGSVWASWTEGNTINAGDTRVLRYLDGEWVDHSGADGLGGLFDLESNGNYVCDITDTTDGAVYVGVCGAGGGGFGAGGLFRYLEGRWERVRVFAEIGRTDILISDQGPLVSSPDGTLWAATWTTTPQIAEAAAAGDWSVVNELSAGSEALPLLGPVLLRLRDGRWSAYAWHDLEPDWQHLPMLWDASDALAVDADGVLWFGSAGVSGRSQPMIGSFDGDELRWYPEVAGAHDLEIGPDGHPWIAAADGIYVIDPAEVQRDLDEPGPE